MSLIPFDHAKKIKKNKEKRLVLHEGDTKNLLDDCENRHLILEFKDNLVQKKNIATFKASNIDYKKNIQIPGKGSINNRLSAFFFSALQERGIHNHYIDVLNMNEQKIRSSVPLPFTITYHNGADQNLCDAFGFPKGQMLPSPFIEYKRDMEHHLQAYPISEDHIISLQMVPADELLKIKNIAQRANDFLSGLLLSKGLRLLNIKLEFGYTEEDDFFYEDPELLIIDEITPDTMTLQDLDSNKILDTHNLSENVYQTVFKKFLNQ
jgi:phosphoribosylaminoimidazole-succinocarboxamide synthase